MDDKQIVDLFFNRDEWAIKETDKKYGKLCLRIADNILSNREDAEECVNDAYLAAWKKIPPECPGNLSAFISKIVRNLSLKRLEFLNAKKRSAESVISLSEIDEAIPDDSFMMSIEDDEIAKLISVFLRKEKELDRNVFLRKYWFFDTVSDIAGMYSLSETSVKAKLFRTRNRLRDYLKKEGYKV